MKTTPTKFPIHIREKVSFTFVHEHNAVKVATALTFVGYYVRCVVTSTGYQVYVYTDREV